MGSRARKIAKSVHSEGQAHLCGLLIAARKRTGLTQQELARRLGQHQPFVAMV
jgi:cyanate lyase